MNGYRLAEAIRQQDTTLPIIGVTANALREEGERCAAVGMNAWMVKPLNLATLRAQLEQHCKIAMAPVIDAPPSLSQKCASCLSPPCARIFRPPDGTGCGRCQ
jgi:two-component system capsular synthesis sensor histidine kinase RcsC